MLTLYTYDENNIQNEIIVEQKQAIVSGLINNIIEHNNQEYYNIQLNPDNLYPPMNNSRKRNKYMLIYIKQYIELCNGDILSEIPAPCIYPNKQNPDLRTATLIDEKTKAMDDKWANYIDNVVINCPKNKEQLYNTEDLFCLLHTANYLDLKHLVSLCAVKIASYMALCQWSDNILENVPINFKRALDGFNIIL